MGNAKVASNGSKPRLTIGLPVYNGERYLRFTLDALLSQTFTDFEIIISDNASDDSTMQICQDYAARDPRIRYLRNLKNVGAAENFNLLVPLARGELFKWAAADDVHSPTFLEKCVEAMDRSPELVLSYTKANRINSSGEVDGAYDFPMRVNSPHAHVRFSDLILINHFCIAIFGVIRRDVLMQTPLIGKYVGSDRVLLAELALHGPLYEVPEYLFHRRDHPNTSGRLFKKHKRLAWFDPAKRRQLNLVYWKIGFEYLQSVKRSGLNYSEKLLCYQSIARWFIRQRRLLFDDTKAAVYQMFPFTRAILAFARKLQNKRMNTGGGI